MKISIITVCFNSEATIEDTLKSIRIQDYKDIEYLLIDGGSTDQTLQILNNYSDVITKVISEPDKGIYDAMNKGIRLATGDVIGVLNSDDFYKTSQSISRIVNIFSKGVDAVYGNIEYVDKINTSKVIRYWHSGNFSRLKMKFGWMPPHPSFFVKAEVYKKYGLFNTQLKISADYELMLRFIYKHKLKIAYLNETIVSMRVGGMSNKSIKNRLRANKEDKMAWKINDLDYSFLTVLLKTIRKLPQFIVKGKPK